MSSLFTPIVKIVGESDSLSAKIRSIVGGSFTELHSAAYNGNLARVKKLIQSGMDLNAQISQFGYTALAGAATANHANVVRALIKGGADVNLTFDDGHSALCLAVEDGHLEVVKILIENGANIDIRTTKLHNSPLHLAANNGHFDIVSFLMNNGADVNAANDAGVRPLHCAAQSGHTKVVKALISKGAHINAGADSTGGFKNVTPLLLAVQYRHIDVVKVILEAGADAEIRTGTGLTALHMACGEGHSDIVTILLEKCDVNCKDASGATPLHLASDFGHEKVVSILLNSVNIQASPKTSKKITPLHLAALKGHFKVVQLLLAKGAEVNVKEAGGLTPLHVALQHGNEEVCHVLIDSGADVNAFNEKQWTPLHEACYSGCTLDLIDKLIIKGSSLNAALCLAAKLNNLDILKLLIEKGADVDAADMEGRNPLHVAAINGNLEAVEFLIGKVSNINVKEKKPLNSSPLHLAAEANHVKIAEVLLKNGADVNVQDLALCTPLHIAALEGHNKMFKLMLKYGVNLTLKDDEGRTPLHFAAICLHPSVVKQLLLLGAQVDARMDMNVTPLHLAAEDDRLEVVRVLLTGGACIDAKSTDRNFLPIDFARSNKNTSVTNLLDLVNALFTSTIKSDVNQMRECIKKGAIPNARNVSGRTPLHYAVFNSNLDAVKLLLENKADVSLVTSKGNTPLHTAVSAGRNDILEILLLYAKQLSFVQFSLLVNCKTSGKGTTALHVAAEKNNTTAVKLLLEHGSVHNATNFSSKTPTQLTTNHSIKDLLNSIGRLHLTLSMTGNKEAVQFSKVDKGIMNARNRDGKTLLYLSISYTHSDNATFLLANGADYTLVAKDGKTPLHVSCAKGNSYLTEALLAAAKNSNPGRLNDFVNSPTSAAGTVALHVASNEAVAKLLLQNGAIYNFKNKKGKTPLDVTKSDTVRRLLEFVNELFEDSKKADPKIAIKVQELINKDSGKLGAVINARNERGYTLFQVLDARAKEKNASLIKKDVHECSEK